MSTGCGYSCIDENIFIFLNQAQTNLTELNSILWGTCNTDASQQQCSSNMASFADQLHSSCANELSANNNQVVQTLQGVLYIQLCEHILDIFSRPTSI